MESGTVVGVATIACTVAAQVLVTNSSLKRSTNWMDVVAHVVVTAAVLGAIAAVSIGFAYAFDVVDSSHGFVSIILPTIFAFLCLVASSISVVIRILHLKRG